MAWCHDRRTGRWHDQYIDSLTQNEVVTPCISVYNMLIAAHHHRSSPSTFTIFHCIMAPPQITGFTLEWSDDFQGPSTSQPNTNDWDMKTDGPNWWGNHEVQQYTNTIANVCLSGGADGSLYIIPTRIAPDPATFTQPTDPPNWNSGRVECNLSWNCNPKQKMLFQANIRTPGWTSAANKGIWPAFWALGDIIRAAPSIPWPLCGEWDIMEKRGTWDFSVSSVHSGYVYNYLANAGGTNNSAAHTSTYDPSQWNTFAIQIDCTKPGEESITWLLNGEPGLSVTNFE